MHKRNPSLDRLAGVMGGGGGGGGRESTSGGGGFSYGTTPPLTQATTAAQQAKLQQEKQKYKERHQHLLSHEEFSQSAESLQEAVLTPMSSTTTLSTVNSRAQTSRDSVAGNGGRDSSYFPPTPPASIRVASPVATPRGHAHSGSQQSVMSDRAPTSRSSTSISLNGLFSSGSTAGQTSAQGAAQGGKKQKSAASSIRSRFTFSTLIGGGSDKDKGHGRQASVGSHQMQQQQAYLQHLLQEEERLQQEDAPLPPLPPPTSPAQREREWADQSDRNSIRRRSVNSVYSETGRRTPTSPDEMRKGLTPVVGTRWTEDGTAGTRRSGSLSTARTDDTPIVYDQDVDMSRIEDLIGAHSPIESDAENSDAGGGTVTSITPSLFRRNRKELEGSGIATGESTMLGNIVYVDGKLLRLNSSGSVASIGSIRSIRGSVRSVDNFPLPTKQQFLGVEDRDPISPLRPTSMELPHSSPSSQTSVENGPVATASETDPVKRSPSCSSTMSQVKRKPSPVTASFSPTTVQAGSSIPSTPLPSVAEPDPGKPPTTPPQAPLPAPPIITTTAAPTPPNNNPITNVILSPLTNNSGETAIPTAWGGRMEVSQVELPPPPSHTRSPLPDSPISAQYAVERKKKLIDEEWEDLEREDPGDRDAPPPPYVARMSMMNAGSGEDLGMWEDEKAIIRQEMMHRRSLPGMPLSRRSTLQEETVESLNAGEGGEFMGNSSQENLDLQMKRSPTTPAIPSGRADIENQGEWRPLVEDTGAFDQINSDQKASSPTGNVKPSQRTTTPGKPGISTTRSNPTSTANSPTVGRKRTILKKPGATPKISTNLSRSNTRNKLRFSHVAPEVVIPSLPISLNTSSSPVVADEAKGKQCKTCKSVKGGSLANKYRELLIRERESFALERSIWDEERKGYEKKVVDLEKRLRRLVEVLARGDEGGDDEDAVEEEIAQENTVEVEEVEDVQPVMSATGGLSVNTPASGSSTRRNSFRDTGKEVDRSHMNQPSRDRNGGAWSRQTGLPTPPSSGAIAPFSRAPTTTEAGPTSSGGNQYWNNFLDDHRTVPPTRASGSGSNYGYRASSSASSSSWGGASRTWGGTSSSSNMGGWSEAGSHTYGGWGNQDPDPRMKVPITEERAVYARLYAEASIGIGGPTGELLH